ncbi:unnamed protein product [Heterobilharzia americana]|nr:unnamed protein product [Heterobilharzia americana]
MCCANTLHGSDNLRLLIVLSKFIKGTNCFKFLKRRLPPHTIKRLNELVNLRCKITSERERIGFYQSCISGHMFPRQFYKTLKSNKLQPNISNLMRLTKSHVENGQDKLHDMLLLHINVSNILSDLSIICRLKFLQFCSNVILKTKANMHQKLTSSLDSKNHINHFPVNPDKYVTNLSTVTLSTYQKEALSLGLKFCVPRKQSSDLATHAQFENLYNQLKPLVPTSIEDQGWLKAKMVDIAHQFCDSHQNQKSILTSEHFRAMKELRENPDIIILRPDKGSGVVIMDKIEYKCKMSSILEDENKFTKDCSSEDVQLLQGTVTANLVKLLEMNVITSQKFALLKPTESRFPHLYGLPKVHKPNNPLRPIMSMCKSPTHKLAQWLVELLDPIKKQFCKYSLKDTFEVIKCLEHVNIKGKFMCSFDVNSLFTNVPLVKTIDILCGYISVHKFPIPITLDHLKQLLLLCTNNIKFTFEGEHFRQVDGVAMGSPLGPLLADIFMSHVENLAENLIDQAHLYRRYVDDILIICENSNQATSILNRLNEVQNSISLTCVREEMTACRS